MMGSRERRGYRKQRMRLARRWKPRGTAEPSAPLYTTGAVRTQEHVRGKHVPVAGRERPSESVVKQPGNTSVLLTKAIFAWLQLRRQPDGVSRTVEHVDWIQKRANVCDLFGHRRREGC